MSAAVHTVPSAKSTFSILSKMVPSNQFFTVMLSALLSVSTMSLPTRLRVMPAAAGVAKVSEVLGLPGSQDNVGHQDFSCSFTFASR